MIIDCISDLHGHHPDLEGGDLLIIAGDLTANDMPDQLWNFCQWVIDQKYTYKVLVAGNHDNILYDYYKRNEKPFVPFAYLCDSLVEIDGYKIWGSPWTTTFPGMNPRCKAFTCETEDELFNYFEKIPHDVDILITHSPPQGIGDLVKDQVFDAGRECGSVKLRGLFEYAIRPYLHVFGHIHEGYGQYEVFSGYDQKMVKSVNASHVNEYYLPCNQPIRIELNSPPISTLII